MHLNWKILKKDLKNTFQCKYYRIRNILTYPSSILPKTRYISKIQVDALWSGQDLFIIRRSDFDFDNTFQKIGEIFLLREDAIQIEEIPNLSLNLIGRHFKEKHIVFSPKGKLATARWDGVRKIYLSEFLKDYVRKQDGCSIFFHVNKIDKVQFPYQQPKAKEINKLLAELGEQPVEINDKYIFNGHTSVVHDPTNLNYWHTEFRLTDFREEVISNKKPGWVKQICIQTFKNVLAVNAYTKLPSKLKPISKRNYLKKYRALK